MNAFLRIRFVFACLAIIALMSCEKDDDMGAGSNLLVNGNIEEGTFRPEGWFSGPCADIYNFSWAEEDFFSSKKSLKIRAAVADSSCVTFWGQSTGSNIPIGKSVTLSVQIKGDLVGEGASIAIRGDDSNSLNGPAEQFVATQNMQPISGTFDWTEFTVILPEVASTTQILTVYLILLPKTSGEVFFDDVSLSY